ncbi:hypothetical protein [Pediococcus ethanolidurans]
MIYSLYPLLTVVSGISLHPVQKAAEFVTDTNDKNGIALVLNSVMKNGNYPKL